MTRKLKARGKAKKHATKKMEVVEGVPVTVRLVRNRRSVVPRHRAILHKSSNAYPMLIDALNVAPVRAYLESEGIKLERDNFAFEVRTRLISAFVVPDDGDDIKVIVRQHKMIVLNRDLSDVGGNRKMGHKTSHVISDVYGMFLRQLRERRGIAQVELARRTRASQGYISAIEHGKKTPSFRFFRELVASLGGLTSAEHLEFRSALQVLASDHGLPEPELAQGLTEAAPHDNDHVVVSTSAISEEAGRNRDSRDE